MLLAAIVLGKNNFEMSNLLIGSNQWILCYEKLKKKSVTQDLLDDFSFFCAYLFK